MWGGGIFAGEETTDTRTNERRGAYGSSQARRIAQSSLKPAKTEMKPRERRSLKTCQSDSRTTEGRHPMFLSFAKIHYFDFEGEAQKFVIQLLKQFSKFFLLSLKMSLERNMKTCVI